MKGRVLDTRFSIALHLLILISESDRPMPSAEMARSVGTNPSFARKILGCLKRAGFITSKRGVSGFALVQPVNEITLLQVYEAVYGDGGIELFDIHKNPNDKCLVGRYIRPTLQDAFDDIQREAEQQMRQMTVADCIADMRRRAAADGAL